MSTVKLTELPVINHLDTNTANVILVGVDLPSDVTSQFTIKTLSEGLYANNILNVGNNEILFPGIIGQFVGNNQSYLQINLENNNRNGSSDFVATADVGTDIKNYIDLGIAGSNNYSAGYSSILPLDGYLYVQGNTGQPGGNLIIGTQEPNRDVVISIGGMDSENIFARFSTTSGFKLVNKPITFADGTSQNTSAVDGIQSSGSYGNSAFLKANSAYGSQNTTGVYANSAFLKANSSYESQNTTGLYANSAYSQANTATNNAAGASLYANGALTQANAAFLIANTPTHVANSAALYANGAFTKANAALANATGTFNGSLTLTNDLNVSGIVKFSNTGFSSTQALLTISSSNTGAVQTPIADGYMIHTTGKHNVPTRIVSDSFGANGQLVFPAYVGRAARGNVTNPSAVQTNDILLRLAGSGYGATNYQVGGVARIDVVATENHTDTARGTAIKLYNVANGTNVVSEIVTFNANDVIFTGVVSPEKGFIYTPRILSGAQTAITINFATDSMIRSEFNSTLTISFSNYTYGKVVECWFTNTAGNGQTINMGVLANNSTTGSSTLSVASGRSAKLQYFSIDGDLANTFVAITYA